jgi:hypothetical protein
MDKVRVNRGDPDHCWEKGMKLNRIIVRRNKSVERIGLQGEIRNIVGRYKSVDIVQTKNRSG